MIGCRTLALCAALLGAGVVASPAAARATAPAPWRAAAEMRSSLAAAERALVLGNGEQSAAVDARAARRAAAPLLAGLRTAAPDAGARLARALGAASAAAEAEDAPAFAAARADAWTALLDGSAAGVEAAVDSGDAAGGTGWLLVREFRAPTRFTRPGVDATLALAALSRGRMSRHAALAAVRADLLDTYQARLNTVLSELDDATRLGYPIRTAGSAALARGYFAILADAYEGQRGPRRTDAASSAFARLARAALADNRRAIVAARRAVDRALDGFRAAPLAPAEEARRAGQILRFLALVPIEYDRGVEGGRVTLDFELQEAISFRDGAASAFADLEPALARRDRVAATRLEALISSLGDDLGAAARGERVTPPETLERTTKAAVELAERTFPEAWRDAGSTADFDVIRATLDRLEAAARAGQFGAAEQARIEAYAVFEFGPEQRLRGLAPGLFVRVEGLFWYGADGHDGLARLVKRKGRPDEVSATLARLRRALVDAESAVGSGPTSRTAVVSNTAVIVFREGLEAVLIVSALIAGMVRDQRRFRRPLLAGVAAAAVATAATWLVAQTVLASLARYGEKLEAIVSLGAIAVLLVVLNWFYHRVYWSEHLAGLHSRKKRILTGGLAGVVGAQALGLAALGFSSVYREGFETVLFLQALVLEAGLVDVLLGVAVGLVGVGAVAVLTVALERKLPHKRMLVATGVLILAVLVVMVGTTMQTLQVVGWAPVHPIEGVLLPYWVGAWLGVFPTWEGVLAQASAAALVLGSYAGAEHLRARRRRAILLRPIATGD